MQGNALQFIEYNYTIPGQYKQVPVKEEVGGNVLSFRLNRSVANIEQCFAEAMVSFNIQPCMTYTAMSGQRQQVMCGVEDHEDEDDLLMLERGPHAMSVSEFFVVKVRMAIDRVMHTVGKLQTRNVCIEEFFEDPKYYRDFVRNKSHQYIPMTGCDRKRGVQSVDYRFMDTKQFMDSFGEIAPVRRRSDVVYLIHGSVRFYYKFKQYKVGIIVNVERYCD
jgi:hypothetical protein